MVEIRMKNFMESCANMTELIISCWDENNPDDGSSFDERLAEKIAGLKGTDLEVMKKVVVNV